MKQIITAILLIVLAVSLVVVSFTFQQADQEQKNLTLDLQHRSSLLAESLIDTVQPYVINNNTYYLQKTVDKFTDRERLVGLVVYDNKDNILSLTTGLSTELAKDQTLSAAVMDTDKADGDFFTFNQKKYYTYVIPLHDDKNSVIGSLMIVQNAGFIDSSIWDIWKSNMIRLLTQAILLSIAVFLIIHWIIYQPIAMLVESMKKARIGRLDSTKMPKHVFFQPLINEISNISKSLLEARNSASQEARLRQEHVDSPWTAQRLKEFSADILKGRELFVVSNREPFVHTKQNGKISFYQPASGMVTAIEPILRACGGTWLAQGSGDADKLVVDSNDNVAVPPDDPKYNLHRVWLTKEEEKGYYYGFSNEGLWPLCHNAYTRPIFRKEDWHEYQRVNGKFTQAILKQIKDVHKPIILVQDYHFALLPQMIKNSRPDATIGVFWHIPWPHAESFGICPWRKELLEGMLGADLIGFHTQLHCNNFIDTISHELEALIDLEQFSVQKENHISFVKSFPISIPFDEDGPDGSGASFVREDVLKHYDIKTPYVGVGVDRLDYTKGILERLRAIEYLFETHPSYKEKFTFIQIAAPTRSSIPEYSRFAEKVEKETERINTIFKTKNWKPIILLKKHHTHEEINQLYRIANVCLVTSLHDGMNLVAKEYIMSRNDEKGVLILSQFAGASRELKESLIVNPYNIEQTGEAIHTALSMMQSEQVKRMKKLRDRVRNYNVYRWSADLLKTLITIEQ